MQRLVIAFLLAMSVLYGTSAAMAAGGSRQCDFNGDGYDDAAIGVAGEAVGAATEAGAVNVLYGGSGGLSAAGNQLWTQNTAGVEGVAEAGDLFGKSVECGDFNGDGYADLAIGVPFEDIGTVPDAGAVHVLFGTASGLGTDKSLLIHRDVAGVAGRAAPQAVFGWSLAAGDFDNDGRDDLAVGSPFSPVAGLTAAGNVHVFYGSSAGPSEDGDKIWHRERPGIRGAADDFDQFGFSMATGDFDGDDFVDLAIGVRNDRVAGKAEAGSVNVMYGTASGVRGVGDQLFHRGFDEVAGNPRSGDKFGHALAAGDFDDDGYDELAVGVPFDSVSGHGNAGSVQVFPGSSSGLHVAGDRIWHRDKKGVRNEADPADSFGFSLTVGPFNGDGPEDLAIGVIFDDLGSAVGAGSVHVIYGSGKGLTRAGDEVWHQGTFGIRDRNESLDAWGSSVSSGDFDGSGWHDLLIAVPSEDLSTATDAGRVAVVYGTADGLAADGNQSWTQNSAGVLGVAEDDDFMGRNVSGGGI